MTLAVLDLYAGCGGWSAAFRDHGHQVLTLDADARHRADIVRDILTVSDLDALERGRSFDVVLASPPCEGFSVAAMGRNWIPDGHGGIAGPRTASAELAVRLAWYTFALINAYLARHPATLAVVENPIGAMRRVIGTPDGWTRRATWQCQWGESRAKPTDLWMRGYHADALPMCRAGASDHAPAPRGSRTPGSTQGTRGAAARATIPYALSLAFCLAAENGTGKVTP